MGEVPPLDKSAETESRTEVTRGWGEWHGELMFNGYSFCSG